MPLVRLDMIEGRSAKQIAELLDAAHRAIVQAFDVPEQDRYQILTEHPQRQIRFEDTGLGIVRTDKSIFVQVTSRFRSRRQKVLFYEVLAFELSNRCGVPPSDLMISFVTSTDEDWSFGNGEAQFLDGKLAAFAPPPHQTMGEPG